MSYKYEWFRSEANFATPIPTEVEGGTHFTVETVPTFRGQYLAFRRPKAVPHHEIPPRAAERKTPSLYFIHDLPIWGESLTSYVDRIVGEQAGVSATRVRVVDFTMKTYDDSPKQWALTLYLVVELDRLPAPGNYGNEVTEVVTFTKDDIPSDFGWYDKPELTGLIMSIEQSR